MRKTIIVLSLVVLTSLPLMADKKSDSAVLAQTDTLILNVPEFFISYQGKALVCSPIELIKKNTHKDLVKFQCQGRYSDHEGEKNQDEAQGHAETERLETEVKNNIAQGSVYSVVIPLYDADKPIIAQLIAEQQLNDRPYGKYLHMLRPAKFYISIRPQLTNSNDGKMELQNGGSRAGFFYYHQYNSDLELLFQYEAKIDTDPDNLFINASDISSSTRRLSYMALKYGEESIIAGKYWSAYYDIAGFTDRFKAYGAQSGGAFNSGTDGSLSGTGRVDKMLQLRSNKEMYDATLQVQFKHDAHKDFNTDYRYTMAGSLTYKGWGDMRVGASINYGKFKEISSEMQNIGINGNDLSAIVGLTYKKNKVSVDAVLSYMKNHMSDDEGNYFDGIGGELYMHYDINDNFRLAGGGNWLIPRNNDYKGEYSIKNTILSLQYTFGKKTFDDMVYVEAYFPNGKLANGENRDASIAIGLRYLIDY